MKYLFILILFLFLSPLVSADTTFFDDSNDAFIISNSPTGEVTGGTTGGGSCSYKWNCTNWNACLPSGKQSRTCTNLGTCSDKYKVPQIEKNCTYADPEVEGSEGEKQDEITEIIGEGIIDKTKLLIYSTIILVIASIIIYLKKDYFKKLITPSEERLLQKANKSQEKMSSLLYKEPF